MQNLPPASTYDDEVKYMPWGKLISQVEEIAINSVPQNGRVLDLLCGTGNLLGRLHTHRPDIIFTGVDLESEYIAFAHDMYPSISFQVGDALTWTSETPYDLVLVTGGLHHIPYENQEKFIQNIAGLTKDNGIAIVADPYIDEYSNEEERKLAAAKLGYEYLIATLRNGATKVVAKATADLIANDVLGVEYKTSIKKMKPIFERYFSRLEQYKTWPETDSEYGDYYFVLRR